MLFRSVEFGYQVDECLHGRGIGTVVVELFIDKIFSETQIDQLIGLVAVENMASRRVLEKCGFKSETRTPDLMHSQDQRLDLVKYVLFRP